MYKKIITSFTWPLGEEQRIQEYSFGEGTLIFLEKTTTFKETYFQGH